jgi:hypothetical protein
MSQFTKAWADAQNAKRTYSATPEAAQASVDSQSEAQLQNAIAQHCANCGWIAFRGAMTHRTYRTIGEPDFTILLPDGKFLLVECKSKTGKLSIEQSGMALWATQLRHKIHVVRSFDEFTKLAYDTLKGVDARPEWKDVPCP